MRCLPFLSCLSLVVVTGAVRPGASSPTPRPAPVAAKPRHGVRIATRSAARLLPGVYPLRAADLGREAAVPDLEPAVLSLGPTPEARGLEEPRYTSARPLYGTLRLGDPGTPVQIALDESLGTGIGYDRLLIDREGDGRLTGPPVEGRLRRSGAFQTVDFDCLVPAVYGTGTAAERRPVRVLIHGYRLDESPWRFTYALAEGRAGEIAAESGGIRVVVADSAMRAAYNRRCSFTTARATGEGTGPELWLSPNPADPASGRPLHLRAGEAQIVGDTLYRFEVTPAGDAIAVRPFEGPAARARIAATSGAGEPTLLDELRLLGPAGCYDLPTMGETQEVPESRYHLLATLRQPGEKGDWSFRFRSRRDLPLPAGAETPLPLGGPIRALIAAERGARPMTARRGERITIPLLFVTSAGHELVAFDPEPGFPAAARVVLRSPAGRTVATSGSGFA